MKPRLVLVIDKELLTWAAAARWLARSKAHDFAILAINEYRALSLRLSNGECMDVLGVANDLMERVLVLLRPVQLASAHAVLKVSEPTLVAIPRQRAATGVRSLHTP